MGLQVLLFERVGRESGWERHQHAQGWVLGQLPLDAAQPEVQVSVAQAPAWHAVVQHAAALQSTVAHVPVPQPMLQAELAAQVTFAQAPEPTQVSEFVVPSSLTLLKQLDVQWTSQLLAVHLTSPLHEPCVHCTLQSPPLQLTSPQEPLLQTTSHLAALHTTVEHAPSRHSMAHELAFAQPTPAAHDPVPLQITLHGTPAGQAGVHP